MENVRKLETTVSNWYKNVPHLPSEARKWLATNIWWLVIVGVVLGGLGVISVISLTFFAGALLAGIGGVAGAVVGGLMMVAVSMALLFSIVCLVIACFAISPLRAMRKKGWSLLFLLTILEVISLAISLVLTFDVFGTIWGLLWVAVGVYLLFEIREYFEPAAATKKKPAVKAEAKPAVK